MTKKLDRTKSYIRVRVLWTGINRFAVFSWTVKARFASHLCCAAFSEVLKQDCFTDGEDIIFHDTNILSSSISRLCTMATNASNEEWVWKDIILTGVYNTVELSTAPANRCALSCFHCFGNYTLQFYVQHCSPAFTGGHFLYGAAGHSLWAPSRLRASRLRYCLWTTVLTRRLDVGVRRLHTWPFLRKPGFSYLLVQEYCRLHEPRRGTTLPVPRLKIFD
jgi:hypothetical protein